MGVAISIQDLSFTYAETTRPALRHINGEVEEGTYVVVMGHEGAGKSTLCCSLNALVPRFFRGEYSGRVLVQGIEVARARVAEMSRRVGLVLQDFEAQLFSTSVELEVAFGPENLRLPRDEIERRIDRYLRFVGLAEMRRREPASLSGGQKQRLAIASVLALEPPVLVMDEPTTDLDPIGREEVLSVADLLRQERRTLLVVDHDPETAVDADQVWLMREGEVIAQGPPREVLTDLALLESCGVQPPPTVALFQALGWPGQPLTVEEAIALIREHGLAHPRPLEAPTAPPNGRPVILELRDVDYVYSTRAVEALKGVNLQIREGEFLAIVGQNGSGKTTLAKHLNGLLKPTRGEVLFRGRPLGEIRRTEMARHVGYVFQNPDHQIFSNTVREEVGFSLRMAGMDPRTIEERVAEALAVVGLSGYEDQVPFTLTKGERQRVAVASVLAAQPQVIILDEPTTGLDYRHQRSMMEMLRGLHRRGHTVIIITHSMWVAAEYAERVVVMKEGRILLDAPTRAAFAQEGILAEASLRPPPLLRLGNWLGTSGLTLDAMVEELRSR
ncbi:MAG: energy-coupling factor transporter ATPase [Anaerolineae bacterium]|nr:energy-coupling factor transporter ATPase [Anaerolineae bacterium]MCX8066663.1 energy-coupling factor transporter ATPase [Anaerolineae bacterium]